MCSTSACDLEDVPLEDDDSNSMEFKILAFYARHHVFKGAPAAFSPKRQRTRSLSQKGLGTWSPDSWMQVPWTSRSSSSPEKQQVSLGKKKSSWRTLFGVTEKEEDPQSSPEGLHFQGPVTVGHQSDFHRQQWPRSHSNVEQRLPSQAVDPKVASIASRVAEIVYSWPPPEDIRLLHRKGVPSRESFVPDSLQYQSQCLECRDASSKKDGEDQIIAKIVELLKYSGDQLERELKKDKALLSSFQDGLSYPVFKTITDQFLRDVDTRGESEVKAQGFKAALAIDAMAKLTAIDNHPMNRVLGFGTKYLKEHFSPWVQQHGGWEKILGISHEEID